MKQVIQISFEENQIKLLKNESKRIGESVACIVRSAVKNYFTQQEVH